MTTILHRCSLGYFLLQHMVSFVFVIQTYQMFVTTNLKVLMPWCFFFFFFVIILCTTELCVVCLFCGVFCREMAHVIQFSASLHVFGHCNGKYTQFPVNYGCFLSFIFIFHIYGNCKKGLDLPLGMGPFTQH